MASSAHQVLQQWFLGEVAHQQLPFPNQVQLNEPQLELGLAEFFRQPDDFLGILALGMSMGQWLCLPMIMIGTALWVWAGRKA